MIDLVLNINPNMQEQAKLLKVNLERTKIISSAEELLEIGDLKYLILDVENYEEVIKIQQKLKGRSINLIILAKDNKFNRKILEKSNVFMLLDVHTSKKQDFHQKNSGLNHIMCRFAKENKIKIGINITKLIEQDKETQISWIGRIRQNISLCKKLGTELKIITLAKNPKELKSPYDLSSLLSILGASTQQQKQIISFI